MIHEAVQKRLIHEDTPANLGESEPPDIKNWFSSYEYESFVLETNDNFGFSDQQESEGLENECDTRSTKRLTDNARESVTNEENKGKLIKCNQSEKYHKCHNQGLETQDSPLLSPEPPGIENWFSSYAYESPEVDTIEDIILSDFKENVTDCNEKKRKEFEKDENLCITPDDLICKQPSKCANSSTKDDQNHPTELPNDDAANASSPENGTRKVEQEGEAGNGFVSIKSKKENYDKSKQVKGMDQSRGVFSCVNKVEEKKKSSERSTLGDLTNIVGEHSCVTGKWKCPRKRKPDVGPPLKQLRLGQWFRQV